MWQLQPFPTHPWLFRFVVGVYAFHQHLTTVVKLRLCLFVDTIQPSGPSQDLWTTPMEASVPIKKNLIKIYKCSDLPYRRRLYKMKLKLKFCCVLRRFAADATIKFSDAQNEMKSEQRNIHSNIYTTSYFSDSCRILLLIIMSRQRTKNRYLFYLCFLSLFTK